MDDIDFGPVTAKYTKLYKDVCPLGDINTTIAKMTSAWPRVYQWYGPNTPHPSQDKVKAGARLYVTLYDKFFLREIYTNNTSEFLESLINKFDYWLPYYDEKLEAYMTKIDWINNRIEQSTKSYAEHEVLDEDSSLTYGKTVTSTDDKHQITDTHYDLPRTTSSENRPSMQDIRDIDDHISTDASSGTDNGTKDHQKDTTISETVSHSGTENLIRAKKDYLDLIRNLFDEFAERFRPLFLEVFL